MREALLVASPAKDDQLHATGTSLIRRAFDVAHLSGNPGWHEMSSAVLKNRMLDLTNRRFDESLWHVGSFQQWLDLFDDILEVDRTRKPPWVRLLDVEGTYAPTCGPVDAPVLDTATQLPKRWRIRHDLWQAIMDVGRAGEWFWAEDHVELLPLHPSESAGYVPMPTFTTTELVELRRLFAEPLDLAEDEQLVIERWATELLPDALLPLALRGLWLGTLKAAVLERLRAWFAEADIAEPIDLVQEPGFKPTHEDPINDLRSFVLRCVQHMTRQELEDMQLPAAALMRITRR